MRGTRPVFNPIIKKLNKMYHETKIMEERIQAELLLPYYNRNASVIPNCLFILKKIVNDIDDILKSDNLKDAVTGEFRIQAEKRLIEIKNEMLIYEQQSLN